MVQLYNFPKMTKNAVFRDCSTHFLKNVTLWEVFEPIFVFKTKNPFGNTRCHLTYIKKIKICRAVKLIIPILQINPIRRTSSAIKFKEKTIISNR